jgi:hypothetical protein
MAYQDNPAQVQREEFCECLYVIDPTGDIEEGSRPPTACVAYPSILNRPGGDPGLCKRGAQMGGMS